MTTPLGNLSGENKKSSTLLTLLNSETIDATNDRNKLASTAEIAINEDISGKSDVMPCASTKQYKCKNQPISSNQNTEARPWRSTTCNRISSKQQSEMDQQGLPLSPDCVTSVINSKYYGDSSIRKHSYHHIDDFDSGIDSAADKIPKMSNDNGRDKSMGMELNSDGMKAKRYNKTAEALKMSGLMDITMKTADLLKKNKQLQKEIDMLKKDSKDFLQNVLNNPENEYIRDTYFSNLDS